MEKKAEEEKTKREDKKNMMEGKEAAEVGVSGSGARVGTIRKREERRTQRISWCEEKERVEFGQDGEMDVSDTFCDATVWIGECGLGRHPKQRREDRG